MLRLRLRLRLIYYGKINRQGDAAQGTRLLSRGLTLLVAGIGSHNATHWYDTVYLETKKEALPNAACASCKFKATT